MDEIIAAVIGLFIALVLFIGGLWAFTAVIGDDDPPADEALARIEAEAKHRSELLKTVDALTARLSEMAEREAATGRPDYGILALAGVMVALILAAAMVGAAWILSNRRPRREYPAHYLGTPYHYHQLDPGPRYLADPAEYHYEIDRRCQ